MCIYIGVVTIQLRVVAPTCGRRAVFPKEDLHFVGVSFNTLDMGVYNSGSLFKYYKENDERGVWGGINSNAAVNLIMHGFYYDTAIGT